MRKVTEKREQLLGLVRLRQSSRWHGYNCIGDYHGGAYECDYVSPYTRGADNVDADVMVLLQDWASDDVLSGPLLNDRRTIGHDPRRPTNKRLCELLRRYFSLELKDVYATNVFPFVKFGSMSDWISKRDLKRAAREFALPQIEIIGPRLVICLGKAAFNAIASAAGHRPAKSLSEAIKNPFKFRESMVWCQAHTGRNSVDRVARDWQRMSAAYELEDTAKTSRR